MIKYFLLSLPERYISFARIILFFFFRQGGGGGGLQRPSPPAPYAYGRLNQTVYENPAVLIVLPVASVATSHLWNMEIRAWVVEEPGLKPYWAGSINDRITGLSSCSVMKLSATFDSVDANEIGLRSLLKSQIVRDFGRGGTSELPTWEI